MEETISQIDRIHCKHLSKRNFYTKYVSKNIPCIITGIEERDGWEMRDSWSQPRTLDLKPLPYVQTNLQTETPYIFCRDECFSGCIRLGCNQIIPHHVYPNRIPNISHISAQYGDAQVPVLGVSTTSKKSAKVLNDENDILCYQQKSLGKFLEEDFSGNVGRENDSVEGAGGYVNYLKDWHFFQHFPHGKNLYKVPEYFSDDWLNKYCDHRHLEDFRFVYIGPEGSSTGIHCDVHMSYSWSANICGQKLWIFYPPGTENLLKDKYGNLLERKIASCPLPNQKCLHFLPYSTDQFPNASQAKSIWFYQFPGDIVFVPSGWFHRVYNLDQTISLNHNWINAWNVFAMWTSLKMDFSETMNHLSELKHQSDYHFLCWNVVKVNSGMDCETFCDFLQFCVHHVTEKAEIDNPGFAFHQLCKTIQDFSQFDCFRGLDECKHLLKNLKESVMVSRMKWETNPP